MIDPFLLPERILSKIHFEPNTGCWLWGGAWTSNHPKYGGYGCVGWNHKVTSAHKVIYEFFNGPVPVGLELDHLCRTRPCCNPRHLEAVTHKINSQRGETGKCSLPATHCPKGHEYIDANVYWHRDYPECKVCTRAAQAGYHGRLPEDKRIARNLAIKNRYHAKKAKLNE